LAQVWCRIYELIDPASPLIGKLSHTYLEAPVILFCLFNLRCLETLLSKGLDLRHEAISLEVMMHCPSFSVLVAAAALLLVQVAASDISVATDGMPTCSVSDFGIFSWACG
jgi:hypothetical protein